MLQLKTQFIACGKVKKIYECKGTYKSNILTEYHIVIEVEAGNTKIDMDIFFLQPQLVKEGDEIKVSGGLINIPMGQSDVSRALLNTMHGKSIYGGSAISL